MTSTHVPPITEEDIANFLTNTPGFFERHAEVLANAQAMADSTLVQLLYDPQTSGGLLAAVSPDQEQSCLNALHAAGYHAAVCIGVVTRADSGATLVSLQEKTLAT